MSHSAESTPDAIDWRGRTLELAVGAVAHGGHCVARHDGRVVFVRHALPGETVLAEVTEDRGGSFCRADAVTVLTPAPERVEPPCRHAHPGGCGGCDFQHVSLAGQRALKRAVVIEQFDRLARLSVDVQVQPLAESGLGWRRRIRFAVGPGGKLGLRAHRSHHVVPIGDCPLGAAGVGDAKALKMSWPGIAEIEVAADDRDKVVTISHRAASARGNGRGKAPRRGSSTDRGGGKQRVEQLSGPPALHYTVAGREFEVDPTGFWQTHPRAAEVFTAAVLEAAQLQPGERALDLYAGAGLFTAALAVAVGKSGQVLGIEGDDVAARHGTTNLADLGWARLRRDAVTPDSVSAAVAELGSVAVIVLDPPRTGAGPEVMRAVLAAQPRAVVYVACDPAALARDVRVAVEDGWQLSALTGYDAFPMTHHVECVAVLRR